MPDKCRVSYLLRTLLSDRISQKGGWNDETKENESEGFQAEFPFWSQNEEDQSS